MFMTAPNIPQYLRGEPAPVAAVGSVLAQLFADILNQPPPPRMQELVRRVREPEEPERYWRRFYERDDHEVVTG
jgi:hypothetical protein